MEIPPDYQYKNYTHLHVNAIRGIELFNQKDFFEAHEELELAWRAELGWVRELYRGILQVGVAYYHISKNNYAGAKKMFERAFAWLNYYPAVCYGVDVDQLREDAKFAYKTLLNLGAQQIENFPPYLFKPVRINKDEE